MSFKFLPYAIGRYNNFVFHINNDHIQYENMNKAIQIAMLKTIEYSPPPWISISWLIFISNTIGLFPLDRVLKQQHTNIYIYLQARKCVEVMDWLFNRVPMKYNS